jgi:hypothetical protein
VTTGYVTVLPSAGRLMASLRDIGYDLPSAVADLVDNSIDAGAREITIRIEADGASSWLRVSDDGMGMTPTRLDEAMRYGTQADYAERALGHFGLGLKTASLSQCRRLTVASRRRASIRTSIRCWDLDHVLARNSWDLERISSRTASERLTGPLAATGHGTVVLWQNLDRVLPRRPTPGLTGKVLSRAAAEISQHLEMVFHRFLSGEAYGDHDRLRILLNGGALEPWDPFARQEPETRTLPRQVLKAEDSSGSALSLEVQPFVLPGQHLFSSPEAHRRAGGPNRWNRHQGFYVYRRDRLIQAGGWNRLRTLDEHAKLARIAVDLPLGREQHFAVDVAKMRVGIPEELRDGLRAIASAAVSAAQDRYRDQLESTVPVVTGSRPARGDAISISRDWPAIMAAVDDVLSHDPRLRDEVLLRLANADSEDVTLVGSDA